MPTDSLMLSSLNMILVKQASPGPEALGSTFGLQQSVSCIARALAPAFTRSATLTLSTQILFTD